MIAAVYEAMSTQRIIVILSGMLGMLLLMLIRRNSFPQIKIWKYPLISAYLTIAGVAGTLLLFFVESGHFGGTSFYGAVLFVPLLMIPVMLLGISFKDLMDLCAPAECLMLTIMKTDCIMSNCCIGKYLPSLGFQFPSQIIEMITAFFVMLILLDMEAKAKYRGKLYAWYLILYGTTRFALNWFRYGIKPFVLGLPAGNFWSVIAVILGLVWLAMLRTGKTHSKRPSCGRE